MNKSTVLVALLASTLALGASAVNAQETTEAAGDKKGYSKHKDGKKGGKHHGKRHGKRHGGKGHGMKRIAKKLELTEAQIAELKTLREEQKAVSEPLREQMKEIRAEMKALDTTSADYDSQVAAIADKKATVDRQRFIQRSAARQKFEAVLTAEQLTKLKEMKENRKGKRGGKGKQDKGE
ncbi:hypothetical protein EOL70_09665 [Leucothrix sargassi]|nr:hypothetical protein EOL70_09665 [Leucothrix sargassi]